MMLREMAGGAPPLAAAATPAYSASHHKEDPPMRATQIAAFALVLGLGAVPMLVHGQTARPLRRAPGPKKPR